jgi:hypothetical protein
MPVWGDAFKRSGQGGSEDAIKARIDALVEHIRSLQVLPASATPPVPPRQPSTSER